MEEIGNSWTNIVPFVAGRRIGDDFEFALRPSAEEEEIVSVFFSRIRERNGDPRADVAVWYGPPRGLQLDGPPLLQDQVWINAGRERERLAGRIARFVKKQAPWAEWIEVICYAAKTAWERGEAVQQLSAVADTGELSYLIHPLLPDGETTLLYGDGESGKSLLAMFVAVVAATGVDLPGIELRGAPCSVLYLDWETNAGIAARRMNQITAGYGIAPPSGIYYRRMARALSDDLRIVRAEVDRLGVGLVIIDSVGPACGGSPSKEELIVPFFNAVRSLGRTALLISHISKMEAGIEGTKATPIGSVYSRNLSRQTWLARRAEGVEESDAIYVALFHTKANESKRFRPIGLRIAFTANTIRVAGVSPGDVPALAEHLPLAARVRSLLSQRKHTAKELAEQLGVAESTVRGVLVKMPDTLAVEPGGPRKPAVWALRAVDGDEPF